ncbi:fumarylacetoacetate hydrolase family protein [Leifsonia sp. ZF2019]|uniref:fumarylacetoacetate hydrolase family protein n=1 Tax=Leifsonia sp. ZF2019 TaxID=2781978 RepID=UPI001CBDD383|nr:fumarylacetoacetate hydrolase family protein [Leifsonia sp. ZF2019]
MRRSRHLSNRGSCSGWRTIPAPRTRCSHRRRSPNRPAPSSDPGSRSGSTRRSAPWSRRESSRSSSRRRARHLHADEVAAHVLGFTIGNDVTAVEQIARDSLLTQAKNGDGFTPLGPWIETDLDPAGLGIRAEAGDRVATGSVDGLARGVVELLVHLTGVLELGPGDVVLTGCPGTGVPVAAGDTARIHIDGLGELANPVVAAGRHRRGSE